MRRAGFVMIVALMLSSPAVTAGDEGEKKEAEKQQVEKERLESERAQIDVMARTTLDRLFAETPEAKGVHEDAYGHAVFDTTKVAFVVSGGGGAGVAVSEDGRRVYMRMATAGVGLGAGAQNYQVVFFFEDKGTFDHFVSEGWNAEASADMGAGDHGASSSGTSSRGITIFKLADEGLLLNADLSGTRFWKPKKLND